MRVEVDTLFQVRAARGSVVLGGEPHVVHCHYYNHFLQTSIEDAEDLYPVEEVLVGTAQEIGHSLFRRLFAELDVRDVGRRKALVESIYSTCGFGKVDLGGVNSEGGTLATPYEHYAYTYVATFPPRPPHKRGVAYFSQGYLAGALEAIYDLPLGSMGSRQVACLTKGDSEVRWEFFRLNHPLPLSPSVGEGRYEEAELYQPSFTRVPMRQIRDAVLRLPLGPDSETGLIEAFGVVLTRLPGNYYSLISERHLRRMVEAVGPEVADVVLDMLIESGHVCAFNTLGGVMQSAEWDAIVRPHLDGPESWIYGISAVLPALGWGIVQISVPPTPASWRLSLKNWYESTAIGALSHPALDHSPFARGLFSGIMALVYVARLHEQQVMFDGALYRNLFQNGRRYEGTFVESRLAGGTADVMEVKTK